MDQFSGGRSTVIGQPNFTSRDTGTSATGLWGPAGIAFDSAGRLFLSDNRNHRVLIFNTKALDGSSTSTSDACLVARAGAPGEALRMLRSFRDFVLGNGSSLGRLFVSLYYRLC